MITFVMMLWRPFCFYDTGSGSVRGIMSLPQPLIPKTCRLSK